MHLCVYELAYYSDSNYFFHNFIAILLGDFSERVKIVEKEGGSVLKIGIGFENRKNMVS